MPIGRVNPQPLVAPREFAPQPIPSCSYYCARDVFLTLCSGALSIGFGIIVADSSDPVNKAICAVSAAMFGGLAITLTAYGVTIRCCPQTQQFWNRVCGHLTPLPTYAEG